MLADTPLLALILVAGRVEFEASRRINRFSRNVVASAVRPF